MQFPYGLSDFGTLIEGGYWYQDRTDRLADLEATGRQLIFLRPRRFGKSLLLSMLEHYYDLNRADDFERLFGAGRRARSHAAAQSVFRLKWDFSLIPAYGEIADIEAALHQHLNDVSATSPGAIATDCPSRSPFIPRMRCRPGNRR
jgi:hypothetical protein